MPARALSLGHMTVEPERYEAHADLVSTRMRHPVGVN